MFNQRIRNPYCPRGEISRGDFQSWHGDIWESTSSKGVYTNTYCGQQIWMNQDKGTERGHPWILRRAWREWKEKTSQLDIRRVNHWTRLENASLDERSRNKITLSPGLQPLSCMQNRRCGHSMFIHSNPPSKQVCPGFSSMYSSRSGYLLLPPCNRPTAGIRRNSSQSS
jgi:hypothetical protein